MGQVIQLIEAKKWKKLYSLRGLSIEEKKVAEQLVKIMRSNNYDAKGYVLGCIASYSRNVSIPVKEEPKVDRIAEIKDYIQTCQKRVKRAQERLSSGIIIKGKNKGRPLSANTIIGYECEIKKWEKRIKKLEGDLKDLTGKEA